MSVDRRNKKLGKNRGSQRLDESRRFPRRDALKGLGAWAISGPALAAIGCSAKESGGALSGPQLATAGNLGSAPAGSGATQAAASGGSAASLAQNAAGGVTGAAGIGTSTTGTAAGAGSPAPAGGSMGSSAGRAGDSASAAVGGMPASAGNTAAGSGAAAGAGGTTLSMLQCIVTPAMEEGPFFVEEKLERSNLVMGESDEAIAMATPLRLIMGIYNVEGMSCSPASKISVDIWQANAVGVYSDVASGLVQSVDTRGQKFLRGYQTTDAMGMVTFETIYPGWYMSRTIHIHFKLRMPGSGNTSYDFTSQMFFDEKINAMVLANGVYAKRSGTRSVLNDQDHIYNGQPVGNSSPPANGMPPGKLIMPTVVAMGAGYEATLKIGLKL